MDYINDKDEFTINAGLILNRKPIAGLINAPAKKFHEDRRRSRRCIVADRYYDREIDTYLTR